MKSSTNTRKRLKIPQEVLVRHSDLSVYEIRAILMTIIRSKKNRLRNAYLVDIKLPNIGRLHSRGNKKPKNRQKVLEKDRKRKKREYWLKKSKA